MMFRSIGAELMLFIYRKGEFVEHWSVSSHLSHESRGEAVLPSVYREADQLPTQEYHRHYYPNGRSLMFPVCLGQLSIIWAKIRKVIINIFTSSESLFLTCTVQFLIT